MADKINVQGRAVAQWLSPGAAAKEGGVSSTMFEGDAAKETLLEWHVRKPGEAASQLEIKKWSQVRTYVRIERTCSTARPGPAAGVVQLTVRCVWHPCGPRATDPAPAWDKDEPTKYVCVAPPPLCAPAGAHGMCVHDPGPRILGGAERCATIQIITNCCFG